MKRTIVFMTVALLVATVASPAAGVDKCKVKIDKRTGVLFVDAKGVSGALRWGEDAAAVGNLFFNAGECVSGDTAKKCELADPDTVDSKTPPSECTIYLEDDSASACQTWIKGCIPGARASDLQALDSALADAVAAEAAARQSADSGLQSNIDAETAARSSAVSGEAVTRAAGDDGLQSNIDAEASARVAAVSNEAAARVASDSGLQDDIAAEAATREADDTALDDKTRCITATATDTYFTGCNVHILSGAGSTDGTVNGLGNLIVGYDEDSGSDDKTGSHNLVVGAYHTYSSYGGLVAGQNNSVTDFAASVTGGSASSATAEYSSVSGGWGNTASNIAASVTGGQSNTASGWGSTVGGGYTRSATGNWDWRSGTLFETQ